MPSSRSRAVWLTQAVRGDKNGQGSPASGLGRSPPRRPAAIRPDRARRPRPSCCAPPRNSAGRRSAGAGPGTAQPCAYIISTEFASKSATKPRAPADPGTAAESKANDVFDIYTIIFLALAVFIFLRLRSVLGQRTGRERPPYDPYSARDPVRTPASDKVVALPTRGAEAAPQQVEPAPAPADRWK